MEFPERPDFDYDEEPLWLKKMNDEETRWEERNEMHPMFMKHTKSVKNSSELNSKEFEELKKELEDF